jgi:uncharacterized membrane protein YgcG
MRLPSRWFIAAAAVVVTILAFLGNAIALQVEPPAVGLTATTGAELPRPRQSEAPRGERTRSFDVVTRVSANGLIRVQETIVQDFGFVARHGIERVIPLRDRIGVRSIDDLVVSTSAGTPDGVSISAQTDTVTIRIGDADRTISGVHTYRLEYDLDGMTDARPDNRTRLVIDAISAWQQTIETLSYTVITPSPPTTFTCQQGELDSTQPCASRRRTADGAQFTGTTLLPDDAFTVRLTWPDTAVAATAEVATPAAADAGYAVLAGIAVAFVGWRLRRRWMQLLSAAQTQLWATFGPDIAGPQTEAYDLTGDPAIEFVPPMGLRPGEVGALLDADATKLLTASVVDLAARGALKITESSGSWTLERRNRDLALTDDEQMVLAGIIGDADVATLDDRGSEMGTLAGEVAENLTDDLEDRGLAVHGTDAGGLRGVMRQVWLLVLGVVAVVVGSVLHVVVVTATGSEAAALVIETAFVIAAVLGIGALIVRGTARGLTPLGLAAAWRVRGFDRFFAGSEAMHARAAADTGLFRQYMGYAVVFGHVTQWVAAFDAPDTSDWFDSSVPLNSAFIGFTASSLWSPPASSSSSGFGGGGGGAGGGGGGGGGGSW